MEKALCLAACYCLSLLAAVTASDIAVPQQATEKATNIEGRIVLHGTTLGPSEVRLLLNGGQQVAYVKEDGSFTFLSIPPGTYLMEAVAIGYIYPALRVDVSARVPGKVQVAYAEEPQRILSYPIVLEHIKQISFFEKREEFNPASLLRQPAVIMMLLTLGAVFLIPKMMESIDPEEMKKVQQDMAQTQANNPLSRFLTPQ
eukprot:jgi/Chlat1/4025/Chrsp26S03997